MLEDLERRMEKGQDTDRIALELERSPTGVAKMVHFLRRHPLSSSAIAPRPKRNGVAWTAEEYALLVEMKSQGLDAVSMSAAMERSRCAVKKKLELLGGAERPSHAERHVYRPNTSLLTDCSIEDLRYVASSDYDIFEACGGNGIVGPWRTPFSDGYDWDTPGTPGTPGTQGTYMSTPEACA